jgi:hypothetical protein
MVMIRKFEHYHQSYDWQIAKQIIITETHIYSFQNYMNGQGTTVLGRESLDHTFKESEKLKISHRIRLDGMVATDISTNGHHTIFGRRVVPANDPMFGDYCSFKIQIDVRWYNINGRRASANDESDDIHCLINGKIVCDDFGGNRIVEKFSDYLYKPDTKCIVFTGDDDGYSCFWASMYFSDNIVPFDSNWMRCRLTSSYILPFPLPKINYKKVPMDNTKN